MKTFEFDVTQRVRVSLDETKFTPVVMDEFNQCISDFGTDEAAFVRHGEHIAQLIARGVVDFHPKDCVEGYGMVAEAGISAQVLDDYFFIEQQFSEETSQ